MGFFDKVKEVGKTAGQAVAKGGVALLAVKYGTVLSGKHNLCQVAMNNTRDTLVFMKLTNEEAKHVIKDDIKTFEFADVNREKDSYFIYLYFNDGEKSFVSISIDQQAQSLSAKYKNAGVFMQKLLEHVPKVDDATREMAELIIAYAGK